MTVQLDIVVSDIASTISAGFTHIKVYRSAQQTTGFVEITTPSSIIALQVGVSNYTFLDGNGTTELWYYTTFWDNNLIVAESAASTVFQGTFVDTNFSPITYPEETVLTSSDRYTVDRIRYLIGDTKELTRDYVSAAGGYSSISVDGFTHTLSNPGGWPLRVIKDGTEHIVVTEPRVNDYQFITFSGSALSTVSGVLDVWYYHFRNSDAEVLRVFNGLTTPPMLEDSEVTFELAAICAAIILLENELRLFGVTSGSEVDIFQEIRINPKGGVDGRISDLNNLIERKNKLIEDIKGEQDGINSSDICGVLID